jgi:dGTPase
LSGITQVITPSGSHPTHNRLTHSLEVAQIARSVAERLLAAHSNDQFDVVGGLDADATEAAALAHDLGHPPFGHVSETVLNRLLDSNPDSSEGFEGNAQTFRILTKLATRFEEAELNLDVIPRVVADTVASFTEAQAISLNKRLTGNSLGAVLDPIF